jgi:uncharacterized membrane protein
MPVPILEKDQTMLKVITVAAIAALALAVTVAPKPALARDGAVAAGVIGGLAVGAIIGSQANRGYYGGPGYYEQSYQPAYDDGDCHIERQRVADGYGRVYIRRVRVCD